MILLCAIILLSCLIASRFSDKIGMPALLLFMALGMIFGSDGLFKISFDNYIVTEKICNVALIFIMFYGGFGTKWSVAKPVAKKSICLSTVGVVITAGLSSLFCIYVLKFDTLEAFLIGAVISSTDAASVFSILRSKNLSLKEGTSSMLEIESGSNDPAAYMFTVLILQAMKGSNNLFEIGGMIIAQVVFGILVGVCVAKAGLFVIQRTKIVDDGLESIFMITLVLISYSLAESLGGNGYLSVYLTGIILGNSKIKNKIVLVHFFDGITGLAQILIFFLLGLLAFPHKLPAIIIPSILIALFLTFVARPIAVFSILLPFKSSIRQCMLVSWSGLRGAASIVFAIMAMAQGTNMKYDLFHIVFMISLLSVAFQGSLLPYVSRKLDMVDEENDVKKTFTDYQEDSALTLMRVFIPEGHPWDNKTIEKAGIPSDFLALIIKRDGETIIPKGDTLIKTNDSIVFSVPEYNSKDDIKLSEIDINKTHKWKNKTIEELNLPDNILVALIKRGEQNIIPRGKTKILEDDVVVIYN